MHRWITAIFIYIVVISILLYIKPAVMFDNEKNVKKWGIGNNETESMLSLMIVFPIIAIISYYVSVFIETMRIHNSI